MGDKTVLIQAVGLLVAGWVLMKQPWRKQCKEHKWRRSGRLFVCTECGIASFGE